MNQLAASPSEEAVNDWTKIDNKKHWDFLSWVKQAKAFIEGQ
jgi:hypothetical protein